MLNENTIDEQPARRTGDRRQDDVSITEPDRRLADRRKRSPGIAGLVDDLTGTHRPAAESDSARGAD